MAVVFSKLSHEADSTYKAIGGVMTELIRDLDKEKGKHDEVLKAIFSIRKSKKFGERVGGITTFGTFKPMAEGGVFAKDGIEETFGKLAVHNAFGGGFTVTHEMAEDMEIDAAKQATQGFMESYKRTKLDFATQYLTAEGKSFNFGGQTFDRTTGDDEGFFSAAHKIKKGTATFANVFTDKLGDDDVVLNKLANIGRNMKNDSGHSTGWTFDKIIIPSNCPNLERKLKAIIASTQVVGSNNNDINIQKGKWDLVVNHLWEAEKGTEPFILMSSEAQNSFGTLRWYDREALNIRNYIDEDTRNLNWTGYCRYSILPADWRGFIMAGAKEGATLASIGI